MIALREPEPNLREMAAMFAVMLGAGFVLAGLVVAIWAAAYYLPRPRPLPPTTSAGRRVAPASLWGTDPGAAPPAGPFACDVCDFHPYPRQMENPRL